MLHPDMFKTLADEMRGQGESVVRRADALMQLLEAGNMVVRSMRPDAAATEDLLLGDALDTLGIVLTVLEAELQRVAQRKARELIDRGSAR